LRRRLARPEVLRTLRSTDQVDYAAIRALKQPAFAALHRAFVARHRDRATARGRAYARYLAAEGEPLVRFATFLALQERFEQRGIVDWHGWPAAYRDPRSAAVGAFRAGAREAVDRHCFLQFELARQLGTVAATARARGVPIGVYQDLALGSAPGGSDPWSFPELFLNDIDLGAPPDDYSSSGQNWRLPPIDPRRLAASGYEYWIRLLRAAVRHAGALRLDHVMGLVRQYWIPAGMSGADGAYMRFPAADLFGILALESHRAGALVIGEDLGTVPRGLPAVLARWGVLSTRVLYFERSAHGVFRSARAYPTRALVAANTHDLTPLPGSGTVPTLRLLPTSRLLGDARARPRPGGARPRRSSSSAGCVARASWQPAAPWRPVPIWAPPCMRSSPARRRCWSGCRSTTSPASRRRSISRAYPSPAIRAGRAACACRWSRCRQTPTWPAPWTDCRPGRGARRPDEGARRAAGNDRRAWLRRAACWLFSRLRIPLSVVSDACGGAEPVPGSADRRPGRHRVLTTFFYAARGLVRRTEARLVAIGILLRGARYIAARGFDLRLTTWLLQGFFAVFLVIVVVIFQEELRQLFERLALWGLRRRDRAPAAYGPAEIVVSCAAEFARSRVGALIVLVGRQPIARHLHGGVALNGVLSEPLLKSIFDPHSAGHDGAVIIERDTLARFAAHLPLSTDFRQLSGVGTRHGAALGLAERSDAFCIVVSEERGEISIAHQGVLRRLRAPAELEVAVQTFLRTTFPSQSDRHVLWSLLRENWAEKVASLALVIGLWYLFVPGSRPATISYPIAVKVVNLPPGYALEKVEPAEVTAVFSGLRRAFYLFDPHRIDLTVDASMARYGRRTFAVSEDQIHHPPDVTIDDVQPDEIRIVVHSAAGTGQPPAGQ
jgi:DNA integrity scanning protein DisA with diadenylate cyclase activity